MLYGRDHEINHALKSLILKIHSNSSQCERKIMGIAHHYSSSTQR